MTAGTIDGRISAQQCAYRAAAAVLWAHGALWLRAVLMRLDRLSWTQDEIAKVFDVDQRTIGKKIGQIPELEKSLKNILDSGIPHSEVAERFNLPLQLI